MIDYTIVRTPGNNFDLEARVKELCAKGWEPLGGPRFDANSHQWLQAMTKANGVQPPAGQVKLREPKR